ncbi:uncharacterized protein LOC108715139 isoform X4 [Xenopus laevis]|uniref:Uncharacterized protein LOC108715139 isoform X4 n=1 Tax=Xenopus laevis TaxID=8355 RepID=A0A8J1KK61_XENLA|nr:uncharacterized protein LOC108715139 isoform X4 [Xenopus laevis]XP_041416639.1 uncharacterized protein LOC108715139 isoform X4 [Xenopus laevis]
MPNCFVRGCPHRTGQKSKYPDVTLHAFPQNLHQIKKWLMHTGQHRNNLDIVAQKIMLSKPTNFRMCSIHFLEEFLTFKGSKRTLKPNAVPTIFPNSPVRPIINVQSTSVPAAKRMRVDDNEPSTSFTVVRVISRLVTVGTQTDRIIRTNASTLTNLAMKKDFTTQTEFPVKKEIAIQTGDDSIEAERWKVERDHIYPVCFVDPYKCIDPLENISVVSENKKSHSAKECLSTLRTSAGESSPSPKKPDTYSKDQNFLNPTTESLGQSTILKHCDYVRQRKFIIFEENLDSLLYLIKCQHQQTPPCQAPILDIQKSINGSMVQVKLLCMDGHNSLVWNSQPLSADVSAGNVLLANAVLLCGLSFQKVEKMFHVLRIPFFSDTTYSKYQVSYLFPAIDLQWRQEQESNQKELSGKSVAIAGDCQFDTLGQSAKYCTYTMMDVMSKKILSFTIDQLQRGKNAEVEKTAFETCLDNILDENIDVKIIATDRHDGIGKLMATKYSGVDHQLDVWKLCKSVAKKLVAASRKRHCHDICKWISAIANHLWWCAQTCNQDVDVLLDKWKSVMFHVANKHRFHSLENYTHCQHKRLTAVKERKCAWITSQHPAHTPLSRIINDRALIRDISKIEKFCHTRDLQSFHSKALKYKSKRSSFNMDSMYTDTILAALSHNRNVSREEAKINSAQNSPFGEEHYKVAFSKQKHRDDKYEDVVDDYLFDIMSNSLKILNGELVHLWSSRSRILR